MDHSINNTPLKEIETRQDIDLLVERFYARLMVDPLIGFIFTDVAKIDLPAHLPRIADFWESILMETHQYSGNVLQIHKHLDQQVRLEPEMFDRWQSLFIETLDSLYTGSRAELARQRAMSISMLMQFKMRNPF